MVGHRIAVRNAIAKVDEVAAEEEVEMKIEVAIDMEAEVVEVAVVLMEIVARTGLR